VPTTNFSTVFGGTLQNISFFVTFKALYQSGICLRSNKIPVTMVHWPWFRESSLERGCISSNYISFVREKMITFEVEMLFFSSDYVSFVLWGNGHIEGYVVLLLRLCQFCVLRERVTLRVMLFFSSDYVSFVLWGKWSHWGFCCSFAQNMSVLCVKGKGHFVRVVMLFVCSD
jgi:hypothetical protein